MRRKISNEELHRLSPEDFRHAAKLPCVIVLDNLRSHHNVGSIFRTADAFRLTAIYLCGITACPPHREIHKTALGATETVFWKYFHQTIDAVNHLKEEGYQIAVVEQVTDAIPLHNLQLNKNQQIAFVFGHEIQGVDEKIVDLADFCIEIPQFGSKHSLNVAVAAGMVIWQYYLSINKIS